MRARRTFRYAIAIAAAVSIAHVSPSAQHSYTRSELENGARLYHGSCATCHGAKGDMVRGVALMSGRFQRASTDEAREDHHLRYCRHGDAAQQLLGSRSRHDRRVPARDCGRRQRDCYGWRQRSRQSAVRREGEMCDLSQRHVLYGAGPVRHRPAATSFGTRTVDPEPSASLSPNFRFVRLVTKTGTVVTGRLLNQSTFSAQILVDGGGLRAFDRANLREFAVVKTSLMPSARGVLDSQEVADVVTYLTTLRGQR